MDSMVRQHRFYDAIAPLQDVELIVGAESCEMLNCIDDTGRLIFVLHCFNPACYGLVCLDLWSQVEFKQSVVDLHGLY